MFVPPRRRPHRSQQPPASYALSVLPLAFHSSITGPGSDRGQVGGGGGAGSSWEEANIIVLPRQVLEQHLQDTNLPRFFIVRHLPTNAAVNVAVLEYSAPDGLCYLPMRLLQQMALDDMAPVTVTPFWPHSAQHVRLALDTENAAGADVSNVTLDDFMAPLTSAFQQRYQVVSLFDELSIGHPFTPAHQLRFRVVELQPDTVTATADTDMSVDIDLCLPADTAAPPASQPPVLDAALTDIPSSTASTADEEESVNVMTQTSGHMLGSSGSASDSAADLTRPTESSANAMLRALHEERLQRQRQRQGKLGTDQS